MKAPYTIEQSPYLQDLIETVEKRLAQGYKLSGGMFIDRSSDRQHVCFYQTMVLEGPYREDRFGRVMAVREGE